MMTRKKKSEDSQLVKELRAMSRKKNYKEGELESEFNRMMFFHIFVTIVTTLNCFPEVYKSEPITALFGNLKGSRKKKKEQIETAMVELYYEEHERDLFPLYEYCWKLLEPKLTENEGDGFRFHYL